NYTTTLQAGLNGRTVVFPRGFVLGKILHYLVCTRGSRHDFDWFLRIAGDERWLWDSPVLYHIEKSQTEEFTQPADHHTITGQFNSAMHRFSGINSGTLATVPAFHRFYGHQVY
ncbi:hypothetical protein B0H13DRAFT_1630851, partial [Mycena leptocephala]